MRASSATLPRCESCKKLPEACECHILGTTPSQWGFLNDKRRFLYFNGGRGSGKSTAATLKIAQMIEDGSILPGARIAIFGPTYPQLKKGTIQTFDKWFDAMNLTVKKIEGSEPERRLVNDIVAYFRNASNPDQTRGHEVQLVWLDEVAQMDEQVIPLTNALLRQFGDNAPYQTLMTSTPRGQNWLYRLFVDPTTRKFGDDKVGYYHSSTLEAYEYGIVREDYIEELGYDPNTTIWEQEVLAEFVTWSGLVFPYKASMTPDPFILPKLNRIVGGIDVGTVSPTCLLLVGIDARGAMWVFKEYYQRRANMHEWMRLAGEWTQEHHVQAWYVDSAADIELQAMRAAGFNAFPSIKHQDAALTAVNFINSKMTRSEFWLSPECPMLKAELLTYQYKELPSGFEKTFIDKVKPNQLDHAIDALRYAALPLAARLITQQTPVEIAFGVR